MAEECEYLTTKHLIEERHQSALHDIKRCLKSWAPSHCMSFTVTLKPKLYTFQSITQYEMTHLELMRALSHVSEYVWVAELTKTGNLHYHFVVCDKCKVSIVCLINKLRKFRVFGFYKAIPINNFDHLTKTLMYLLKDLKDTMQILYTANYRPILFDLHFNSIKS